MNDSFRSLRIARPKGMETQLQSETYLTSYSLLDIINPVTLRVTYLKYSALNYLWQAIPDLCRSVCQIISPGDSVIGIGGLTKMV